MSKNIFMDAVNGKPTPRPAIGSGTSIVTRDLMDLAGAFFPEAHFDAEKMAKLAMAGHTILGYDVVMPLFSVWHESAALGCEVRWGDIDHFPDSHDFIYSSADEISFGKDFLEHPAVQTPLDALSILKNELGDDCAVCGKVFGPWTLGYHVFGVEEWLVQALTEPDEIREAIDRLMQATLWFAEAQIAAGADCLLLGDHSTRDLCSPEMYRDLVLPAHKELAKKIDCPLILHTCGDTKDRIGYISESGVECFHWDTKSGDPKDIKVLAGENLSLMGGVSNLETLLRGTVEDVKKQTLAAVNADINIVGPECCVPLGVKVENLKAITECVKEAFPGA